MKTIGVLTSGGDAPGMNAAIRSVVCTGCANGMKVLGIRHGYNGLMAGDMLEMDPGKVTGIVHRGGTILYSARSPEFRTEEGMANAIEVAKANGIEGIVVIGGDGSFRGARDLSMRGLPCVGVPGTIDNDITCSDYTIGYDTCLNTIKEMADRLNDTSESHNRISVIEVMGAGAGYLALNGGIAAGATAILVPESEWDLQRDVVKPILNTLESKMEKKHFIVVVAEEVLRRMKKEGFAENVTELSSIIAERTGVESRATILGHVQRGGSPTVRDRVIATQMGYRAVHLLMDGIGNRVVCMKKEAIVDYDIYEALKMVKPFDFDLLKIAREISV